MTAILRYLKKLPQPSSSFADLAPDITLNFIEKHDLGIAFRAIQDMKGDQGEVVVMVRHTTRDWNS